jgi:hypothetical protein
MTWISCRPSTKERWSSGWHPAKGLATFYRTETVINVLSAPVLDASGEAVLALTAVGDANGFSADLDGDFADALRETAMNLSCRMGHGSDTREPARRLKSAPGA